MAEIDLDTHQAQAAQYLIEKLREELVAYQKDAERYRWLRVMDAYQWDSFFGALDRTATHNKLDAAIDAAMEANRE